MVRIVRPQRPAHDRVRDRRKITVPHDLRRTILKLSCFVILKARQFFRQQSDAVVFPADAVFRIGHRTRARNTMCLHVFTSSQLPFIRRDLPILSSAIPSAFSSAQFCICNFGKKLLVRNAERCPLRPNGPILLKTINARSVFFGHTVSPAEPYSYCRRPCTCGI